MSEKADDLVPTSIRVSPLTELAVADLAGITRDASRLRDEIMASTRLWDSFHQSALTKTIEEVNIQNSRLISTVTGDFDLYHRPLLEMQGSIGATLAQFNKMNVVHKSWIQQVSSPALGIEGIQHDLAKSVSSAFSGASRAQRMFDDIQIPYFDRLAKFPSIDTTAFSSVLAAQATSFNRLLEGVQASDYLLRMPDFLLPGASREQTLTKYAVELIDADGQDQDSVVEIIEAAVSEIGDQSCSSLLASVHPDLVPVYRGAWEAFESRSGDRARHVLASLRELLTHLLHTLAPDSMVKGWSNDPEHFHQNRPTRSARIRFVCRSLEADSFGTFLNNDTKALLELIDLLHRVHELRPCFTDQQLRALIIRTESWIVYLLRVNAENK